MSREIKFRAWIHAYCGGEIPQECYESMDFSDNYQGDLSDFFSLYNPVFFDVMQYTGLKDKNGKEIYEGDVVKDGELIEVIAFGKYGWCTKRSLHYYPLNQLCFLNIKVIGNIHENPELLNN